MSETLASLADDALRKAFYAESRGDIVEALRLYQLGSGPLQRLTETEKDGLSMSFGDLQNKIAELQNRVWVDKGLGKLRRVSVTTGAIDGDFE